MSISAGRFNLNRKVGIDASDMKISGAGIWHTQLHSDSATKLGRWFDFLQDNHVESLAMSICPPTFVHAMVKAQYKAISGTPGRTLTFTIFGPDYF